MKDDSEMWGAIATVGIFLAGGLTWLLRQIFPTYKKVAQMIEESERKMERKQLEQHEENQRSLAHVREEIRELRRDIARIPENVETKIRDFFVFTSRGVK